MDGMTQEQMLDKYIGKKGSPERDNYDAELRKVLDDYRIGEAIKAARKRQGLTQEQLGERMGVQKAQVSKLEKGHRPAYSSIVRDKPFATFSEMADYLSVNRSAVQKQIESFRKKGYIDRRDDGSWHVLALNSKIKKT